MDSNILYGFYAVALGALALFTGEIVTFIMLGIILISLMNINATLKKIYEKNKD